MLIVKVNNAIEPQVRTYEERWQKIKKTRYPIYFIYESPVESLSVLHIFLELHFWMRNHAKRARDMKNAERTNGVYNKQRNCRIYVEKMLMKEKKNQNEEKRQQEKRH